VDAYLICVETKKLIWLGKPIRPKSDPGRVIYYSQNASRHNYEAPLLNKVLWKFLAEHAHQELRAVFSGEFVDDDYEHISTHDVEAEEYVKDLAPVDSGLDSSTCFPVCCSSCEPPCSEFGHRS
jgi:hypothetical protein